MTTLNPVQMERKLRQLDNDVQAIYEMLAGIAATQSRHGHRLGEMDTKLGEMDTKLGEMDTKLGEMDTKLETIIGMLGERGS